MWTRAKLYQDGRGSIKRRNFVKPSTLRYMRRCMPVNYFADKIMFARVHLESTVSRKTSLSPSILRSAICRSIEIPRQKTKMPGTIIYLYYEYTLLQRRNTIRVSKLQRNRISR